jgi:hypothetical protein
MANAVVTPTSAKAMDGMSTQTVMPLPVKLTSALALLDENTWLRESRRRSCS